MQVTPNKANIDGEKAKYKLNGDDHIKAMNIKDFKDVKEEMIVKQAGKNNIKNVIIIGSTSVRFE